jgi:hypothetical protein
VQVALPDQPVADADREVVKCLRRQWKRLRNSHTAEALPVTCSNYEIWCGACE